MASKRPYTVEKVGNNVHVVRMTVSAGWSQWFLLRSDVHHDNAHCRHDLEKQHLDLAVQREAGILEFGDTFCAMQGKWDKRSDRSQLRPEYAHRNDYLGALVSEAGKFYKPYAKQFVMFGYGNHETSIVDKHGSDLLSDLCEKLNKVPGANVSPGGISGYVRFLFERNKTDKEHKPHSTSRTLWYHHGSGGASPVTRGVIGTNRRAVFVSDADFVCTGHTHHAWIVPMERIRLDNHYKIVKTTQTHICIPGYKDGFSDGAQGWENVHEHCPKLLGACWIRFHWFNDEVRHEVILTTEH